jgi:RNA polymerase-binding transcription factor DksA
MTKHETDLFEEFLETEATALRGALQNWDEIKSGEREPVAVSAQKEFALILFDRGTRRLRDINAALSRIEEGCFGECVDCDQEIPAKRLEAIPWASRCLPCEQNKEQESQETPSALRGEKADETTPFRKRCSPAQRPRGLVRGAHGSSL